MMPRSLRITLFVFGVYLLGAACAHIVIIHPASMPAVAAFTLALGAMLHGGSAASVIALGAFLLGYLMRVLGL